MVKIYRRGTNLKLQLPDRVIDGFAYHCYRNRNSVRYVRCYERISRGCYACGRIKNNELHLSTDHDHSRDSELQLFFEFQEDLFNSTISRPYRSLRVIYDYLSVKHHEAAVSYTWAKMEQVMTRWRHQSKPSRPQIPGNLINYVNSLSLPEFSYLTNYPQGQLTAVTLQDVNGDYLTVLYDSNFVASLTTNTFFMDATFKITPRRPKIYQVFTINARINNNALPVCWILMTRKTARAYEAGLGYFRNVVAPHINPSIIMTDYEKGLKVAIRSVYPDAVNTGCFFHFIQALRKKLLKLRLLRLVKTWKYGRIIIRKFMALALLPAEDIISGYIWLRTNLPLEVFVVLQPFITYFHDEWIVRTPPQNWCVFNLTDRTDNFSETYHRKANIRFGNHPSIWDFTEKLTHLQAITRNEKTSLENGDPITRDYRPREDLERDQNIKAAWKLYQEGQLDIPNFLACARNFLAAFKTYDNARDNDVDGINPNYEILMVFQEYGMVLNY